MVERLNILSEFNGSSEFKTSGESNNSSEFKLSNRFNPSSKYILSRKFQDFPVNVERLNQVSFVQYHIM